MAFTRIDRYLWNDKPIHNCSQQELEEAVTVLLKQVKKLKRELSIHESYERDYDSSQGLFDYDDFGVR